MVHKDPKVQAHSGFKSHFSSTHVCDSEFLKNGMNRTMAQGTKFSGPGPALGRVLDSIPAQANPEVWGLLNIFGHLLLTLCDKGVILPLLM